MAHAKTQEYRKTGKWNGDAAELWCCLFFMQRRWRNDGGTPEGKDWQEISTLFEALRYQLTRETDGLPQEELLSQPVFIPPRPEKDPRELRMLDPACGSMHFGLYAFDLYEVIYEEAWDRGMESLRADFPDRNSLLREIPRLIIEHNIHGIDIDPRAVQIAGLSLWLRAQRSWQQQRLPAQKRPQIRRSNIVCAESMPGDKTMLREFIASQFTPEEQPAFTFLLERVFDRMTLAGEAGSLLKIEEEISEAVREAKGVWQKGPQYKPGYLFAEAMPKKPEQLRLDLSGISEVGFWETAEERIYAALPTYAERAESDGYQRRLFAEDAARGFAFIDLIRKHYDAVVMNPPFGSFSKLWTAQSKINYPNSSNDILGAFVERFLNRLYNKGRLGAITSRTCFFLTSFTDWRHNVILKKSAVRVIADLGQGVMDDAMVEAAAYVLENTLPTSNMTVFRAIADTDRQRALEVCLAAHQTGKPESRLFLAYQQTFDLLPDSPFVYWIDNETIQQFNTGSSFEPDVGLVRVGLQTGDDPRYVRTTWEVGYENTLFCYYPSNGDPFCSFDDPIVQAYFERRKKGVPLWAFHVKSGASQPWYSPITLKLNYAQDGVELRNFKNDKGKLKSALRSTIMYHRPGFSWTRRAVRFYPYVIPSNCIPSVSRYMAFPDHGIQAEALGVCASRLVSAFLRFYAEFWQRPNYLVDTLKALPWPRLPDGGKAHFEQLISREVEQRRLAYQNHEPFHEFLLPGKIHDFSYGGKSLAFNPESLLDAETEKMVANAFRFSEEQARAVERDLLEAIAYQKNGGAIDTDDEGLNAGIEEEADEADSDFVLDYSQTAQEEAHLSYLLGIAFGRWDIRYANGERQPPPLPDPFEPLPVCPPGMLQSTIGLPAELKDVPVDYPMSISWSGILVEDESHPVDIIARVQDALKVIWKERWEAIEQEACEILNVKSLRDYFRKPSGFFADHLKRYSKSRRQAPIYWPLSTAKGSYTLWIYYHRLNDQTLHTALADFVDPKIKDVRAEIILLRESNSNRSRLEELLELEGELLVFRAEIERIIKLPWQPNLNDGVLITAAPLWRLFRLPKWQKDLKACWDKLEKGDYDWAHLAYSIWPKRVEEVCKKDRSIAIAHGLEHLCQVEPPKPKAKRGRKKAK
ncbi:BREX-1 system adenine-specific DNA-methyltransferase PglX [Desulfobulbus alkaliphilus]|uniref:BREX-1 system adenine-specific DNA-methyltransferase PglX n=1 Tax=Desulfobulbus alkaliphilus TaxID=869814 RepID=UPI001962FD09|nr:BREX-1 system adenine-specific DNA-methyltransferase PglX [Desulfobulbus alkaliphilus]